MAINTTVENINNQPTIQPRTVTGIFTKYIAKTLPLAFDESMSYYECICALLEYLNETIVPDINNTNDGLSELQTFYLDLQNYVNTYFDNLDVQEEINNKLDAMALNGSLTNLIKNYVDPIYQNYENEINAVINNQNTRISTIDSKVNSATSGSPLAASSTSEMTQTNRIYVNTTDGYWYYYDGDSWKQGGVYQSEENQEVIDARKDYVGYEFDNLKTNINTNTSYIMDKILEISTYNKLFSIGNIGASGGLYPSNQHIRSNTIPAKKGTKFYIDDGYVYKIIMYSIYDHSHIKNSTNSNGTLRDTPYILDDDYMIKIVIATNPLTDLEESDISTLTNALHMNIINDNIIPNDFIQYSNNIFDRDYVYHGHYFNPDNGALSNHTNSELNSKYYYCTPNQTIYTNDDRVLYVCFYNIDNYFVSGIYKRQGNKNFTIPENNDIKFFRVSIYNKSFLENFVISYNEITNDYPLKYINPKYITIPVDQIDNIKKEISHLKYNQTQLIKNNYFKDTYIDHLFINLQSSENVIIGPESIDNLRIAKRLGFNVTEGSIQSTSDGNYIILHGYQHKFGDEVYSLNGDNITNVLINTKTLAWIKENVRFRSIYDKFKTAPLSLEEWLNECKTLQLIPFFKGDNTDAIELANKIVGKGNYITWEGSRDDVDGFIQLSQDNNTTLVQFINHCNTVGLPCATGINLENVSDETLKPIVEGLHEKGYMIAWNSCYSSVSDNQRALKLGYDFSTSGWDIPEIKNGNLCNLAGDIDFEDFNTTGTISDGVLSLDNGETITPSDTLPVYFLTGGSLKINFTGTLHVKFGDFIDEDITSDGKQTNWFSTYFIEDEPTFTLTSIGSTVINNIVYKASRF